jgi:glycosyltransferase involved in cell wall biosynthesis
LPPRLPQPRFRDGFRTRDKIKAMSFDFGKANQILPESFFCCPDNLPQTRPPRLLSAMALAPTLESSFSGSTYHLARAGVSIKKLEGCFSLYSGAKPARSVQVKGALWKLARMLRGQKSKGFKFTNAYLDEVWPKYIEAVAGTTLVNNFQMYGREFGKRRKKLDIGAYLYIDGTLTEYFETYAHYEVAEIDPSTRQRAIEIEREDYHSADGIIAMSKLTALDLQQRYGVPEKKISIIVPGANLLDESVDAAERPSPCDWPDEFVLGFVGLYPLRKGLDRLAQAVRILRGRRLPIRLRVIGNCPDDLRRMEGLEYLGIINKRTDTGLFIKAIASVHLGCLISRAELAGIALLEFRRLGVPILGTRVGGATDILEGGGSVMVGPEIGADELAEVIASLYQDRSTYEKLKREADARREWASWKRAAIELGAVLP